MEYLLRRERLLEQDFLFGLELTLVALLETVFEEDIDEVEDVDGAAFGETSADFFWPEDAASAWFLTLVMLLSLQERFRILLFFGKRLLLLLNILKMSKDVFSFLDSSARISSFNSLIGLGSWMDAAELALVPELEFEHVLSFLAGRADEAVPDAEE